MLRSWKSADKSIQKRVLKSGIFSRKARERATCNVLVEDISVIGVSLEDLVTNYHTEILNDGGEKLVVVGNACAEIDRKVERVLQTMNIYERSSVKLAMPKQQKQEIGGRLQVRHIIVRFTITLIKCDYQKPIWNWEAQDKYHVAFLYKKKGVELFKDDRVVDAFHKFSRACKILITLEPISTTGPNLENRLKLNIEDLRIVLYNNLAMCQLSRKNYQHVISLCNKVLDRDVTNVKALYRRGVAYGSMKNNEKAVQDLRTALALDPNNASAKKYFDIYNCKLQESIKKNKEMMKRMFKG